MNPSMQASMILSWKQKLCQQIHVHVPKSSGFIVLSGQVIILRHDVGGASSLRGLMFFQHLLVSNSISSELQILYMSYTCTYIYFLWRYWNHVTSSEMMSMLENFDITGSWIAKKRSWADQTPDAPPTWVRSGDMQTWFFWWLQYCNINQTYLMELFYQEKSQPRSILPQLTA